MAMAVIPRAGVKAIRLDDTTTLLFVTHKLSIAARHANALTVAAGMPVVCLVHQERAAGGAVSLGVCYSGAVGIRSG